MSLVFNLIRGLAPLVACWHLVMIGVLWTVGRDAGIQILALIGGVAGLSGVIVAISLLMNRQWARVAWIWLNRS
jgi:hypothetical protein